MRHCSGTATNRRSRILIYEIVGSNISLTLTADEINEVIEALDLRTTSPRVKAISEAEAPAEEFEQHACRAELHRLRSVVLTALGAEETQIEASFCAAISTAKEQRSISLEKRAEATYAEYRKQKRTASGGRGFRLPLC